MFSLLSPLAAAVAAAAEPTADPGSLAAQFENVVENNNDNVDIGTTTHPHVVDFSSHEVTTLGPPVEGIPYIYISRPGYTRAGLATICFTMRHSDNATTYYGFCDTIKYEKWIPFWSQNDTLNLYLAVKIYKQKNLFTLISVRLSQQL